MEFCEAIKCNRNKKRIKYLSSNNRKNNNSAIEMYSYCFYTSIFLKEYCKFMENSV